MNIRNNEAQGRYEADVPGGLAFSAYLLKPGKIVFTHTEVPEAAEGHGIGQALVRFALDDARKRGLEVVPLCPFVAEWIRRHKDYKDLVKGAG